MDKELDWILHKRIYTNDEKLFKRLPISALSRMWNNSYILLVGYCKMVQNLERYFLVSKKVIYTSTQDPVIHSEVFTQEKLKHISTKGNWKKMIIAALFITAQRCPPIGEWIFNLLWYVHKME